ncbi:hypothetical protein ACFOD1_05565 [Pseudidiomarina halophila]|uniref:hypothetical protein n=1 Tax=Pseudidiomarina halophila TaxID=1449799 RepID=UPI001F540C82|nr:hypothetical protein [Pseudidiomarina halophila]
MLNPENWTLLQGLILFAILALVIAVAGTRLTRIVDQLADRTGIGESSRGRRIAWRNYINWRFGTVGDRGVEWSR